MAGFQPSSRPILSQVERITAIVARPVLHVGQRAIRFSSGAEQSARHRKIFDHVRAANVVNLADASALQNRQNSAAMIFDMEPIALLLAVAVDR